MNSNKVVSAVLTYVSVMLLLASIILYRDELNRQAAARELALEALEKIPQEELHSKRDLQPIKLNIGTKVNTLITSEYYNEGAWSVSATSASHLANSAYPTESGNIIVYGHDNWHILGNLKELTGDEVVSVELANGETREYKIVEMKKITVDQTEYLGETDSETLTMYTCAGPFDQERFVVRAVPVEVAAVEKVEAKVASESAYIYVSPLDTFTETYFSNL